MLSVTKPALERLSRKLTRRGVAEGMALRFARQDERWTLLLDRESANDTAFSHDGRTVLLLDKAVSEAMANMTLDAKKTGGRLRLKLRRSERDEAV
jgi:hypothetical protein